MDSKTCSRCGTAKSVDDFHRHAGRPDGRQTYCKDCKSSYGKDWYRKNAHIHRVNVAKQQSTRRRAVAEAIRAAKSGPCAECGRRFPAEVMDLDHVRGPKAFPLSAMSRMPLPRVQTEIAKCEPVCARCHRRRTARRKRRRRLIETAGWSCRPPGT